jgi:uncharacterized protein (TIGR02246 family)
MKTLWFKLAIAFSVLPSALAQQPSAADQEMIKVRQAMSEQYAAALAKKDTAAMADLYTEDVVTTSVCPQRPPVAGRAGQVRRFDALLKNGFANFSSKITAAGVISDGVGWSTGTQTFTLTGKDGNPQELSGNWVDMLKREGTVWKVSFQATVTGCSP